MKQRSSIVKSIDLAISQIKDYISIYDLPKEHMLVRDFLKVLFLLKSELEIEDTLINVRLLRGFKDLCTTTAIQYEESIFNDSIFQINTKLEEYIPGYKDMDLLRMDFGKGNPI